MENFRRSTTKTYWMNTTIFFLLPHLHQACFVSNLIGKVVSLTISNILRTIRAMLMNFCIINTPQHVRFLFVGAKYFVCLSRFLPVKRLFQKLDYILKSKSFVKLKVTFSGKLLYF